MACYVDTSIVLRNVFAEGRDVAFWNVHGAAYSSEIVLVESMRALHRRLIAQEINQSQFADAVTGLRELLEYLGVIPMTQAVLQRASGAFPGHVRTLDAIHLATALLWRESGEAVASFMTHDFRQAQVARGLGFDVMGDG